MISYRDRENIVGEQRRPGSERRAVTQIVMGDNVGAAATRK